MSAAVASVLIALGALIVLSTSWAAIALWRMGSRSTAVEAAAATCKQASDAALAAVTRLGDELRGVVRDFQQDLQDVRQELADVKARWREAHDVTEKVNDHETRLSLLEHDHDRNHPPQTSRPVAVEDGAPVDRLFDTQSERKPR